MVSPATIQVREAHEALLQSEDHKAETEKESLRHEQEEEGEDVKYRPIAPPPPPPSSPPSLDEVEAILGYEFKDKLLLEEAFTHSSYHIGNKCFSYERLEYIGDAVINLLVTKEQYFMYPNLAPGRLTRLRAANVDTEKLARVAVRHGLHRYLRHTKPLLEEQIQEFIEDIREFPLHSNGLIDVPKDLADIVESTIGAIFVDCNCSIDSVWKIFKSLLEPVIDLDTIKTHPVTELYEVCQKNHLKIQFVDVWQQSMAINVLIDDKLIGRGICATKKEIALNRAAKNALDNIERILNTCKTTNDDAFDN